MCVSVLPAFTRYAAFKGWEFELLSEDVTDKGGVKVHACQCDYVVCDPRSVCCAVCQCWSQWSRCLWLLEA